MIDFEYSKELAEHVPEPPDPKNLRRNHCSESAWRTGWMHGFHASSLAYPKELARMQKALENVARLTKKALQIKQKSFNDLEEELAYLGKLSRDALDPSWLDS